MVELVAGSLGSSKALLESHILLEVVVEYRVNKVAGVALCSLIDLLQGTKVVHPVQLRTLVDVVVAAHEAVDLVGSRTEGLGKLGSHVLRRSLDAHFNTGL